MLPVAFRRRLQVTHQARIEDIDAVARAICRARRSPPTSRPICPTCPGELAWAHLVIAPRGRLDDRRADRRRTAGDPGAATRARADDHQTANAARDHRAGGARHDRRRRTSRPSSSPSRCRSWASIPARSRMPRRARDRSVGRTRRATSPIWSRAWRAPLRAARRRADPPRGVADRSFDAPGVATDIGTIHFVGIGGIGMSGIAEVMKQPRLYACRARTWPKAMWSQGLREQRHPGDDRPCRRQPRRCGGGRHLDRDRALQPGGRGGARDGACPSCAARRCWPS